MTGKITVARRLRRDMTDAERMLWRLLRNRAVMGVKFRRQHPIGPYIADFAAVENKLIVEADGGQHGEEADRRRTAYLESGGWTVIRYWNNEILENPEGLLQDLSRHLPLSPSEGRGPG